MDNLLENLNKEQLKAVTHKNGPFLIVAGAGTGKTMVITRRIAYLIEEKMAKPEEILALTFTEKAAGEMEERVDLLLPYGYVDLWISTFHSFAERVLKEHGLEIGLPTDFKLFNEFEQWILIKKNLDKFNLDYYRPLGNPTKFIHALVKHFSKLKDENISPQEYLNYAEELKQNLDAMLSSRNAKHITRNAKLNKKNNFKNPPLTPSKGGLNQTAELKESPLRRGTKGDVILDTEIRGEETARINEIANAYHVYNQLLLNEGALDFGDLINYCLKLFKTRKGILNKYRSQFKYILVDEFQDTNWAQYELIKILAVPINNLTVCADDDQSIFRFRGASMSNILLFKKDFPDSEEVILVRNYRSRQNILDLAYKFIQQNNPNRLEFQLKQTKNKIKLDKKLHAHKEGNGVIEILEGNDLRDEIELIIKKIIELRTKDKDASWNDFAVLVRANESAKEICSAFEDAKLPHQFLSSRGLYTKPVIIDLISYLKLLDDYHESSALYRVLKFPLLKFSDSELLEFNHEARKKSCSLYSVIKNANGKFGGAAQEKINNLLNLFEKHTSLTRHKNTSEVAIAFLNDSGIVKDLIKNENQKNREALNYLNSFLKKIKAFEAVHDVKSVKNFLSELEAEIEAGEEGAIPFNPDDGPEAIKILTVHSAKGLEFKYVFIANMVDKRFPTIERHDPISIPDKLIKEILPKGDTHLEEERRLFYVAMTRAKDYLYFSWAPDYGGLKLKKPSQFLVECELVGKEKNTPPAHPPIRQAGPPKGDLKTKGYFLPPKSPNEFNWRVSEKSQNLQIPSFYSYTQLTAFKNCPYQYYFAHILKIPIRGKHTFSFGQTMHLVLQKFFTQLRNPKSVKQKNLFGEIVSENSKEAGLDQLLDLYEENWIEDWYENEKIKREYKEKGKDILKDFYDRHKKNWPKIVGLEQGVNMKINEKRIFGKIDRIDNLGQNKIQIVDYKTGRPKDSKKITPEDKEQLLIYQLAAGQIFNQEVVNLQFYYLDSNSEVNFLGTQKELKDMEEKISERITEIESAAKSNNFKAHPGPLCPFCDFKDICEFRKL